MKSLIISSNFNECILLLNHWLVLIKKLIISTKLTIPLDSRHQTPNKWNETIPTLFSRVRIRSTVFIFVTVSITNVYNGGLKNGNFVVKIYRCFLTVKISKATWWNYRATSTSLLALVQSEVSIHKATSSPESPSNVSPGYIFYICYLLFIWLNFC